MQRQHFSVFISSTMRELEPEREVALETVRGLIGHSPWLFELLPALSESASKAYIAAVRACDVFVVLLWRNYSKAVDDEVREAQRCGKPMLVFIKDTLPGERRGRRLEELMARLGRSHTYKQFRMLSALCTGLVDALQTEVLKLYEAPFVTRSREQMYELGTSIIASAERRLLMFQQTPSLFFGARPYHVPKARKLAYETEFLAALERWIADHFKDPNAECVYLFSSGGARAEVARERSGESDARATRWTRQVRERVHRIVEVSSRSHWRFRFGSVRQPNSGPIIVGDSRFGLWLAGAGDAFSISKYDPKVCDLLATFLKSTTTPEFGSDEQAEGRLLKELGLAPSS